MRKFIITIVNIENNVVKHLIRLNEDIHQTVEKELGGYINIKNSCSSSDFDIDSVNHQSAGTTKDGKFMFSILCYMDHSL